jgi:hypothetical protein
MKVVRARSSSSVQNPSDRKPPVCRDLRRQPALGRDRTSDLWRGMSVDRGPWTVDRKFKTPIRPRSLRAGPDASGFLLTAYCLLATAQAQRAAPVEAQTGLRTLVDIRWNFVEKPSLPATFGPGQRGFPISRIDPKVPLCEADPV